MGIFDFLKRKSNPAAAAEDDVGEDINAAEILAKLEKGDMFGDGCDSDEIPGASGEFGFDVNNPIPVHSILGSHQYLKNLRFSDNTEVHYKRQGSTDSQYVKHPIDVYAIFDSNGEYVCNLHISPYHKKVSEKKPKGFQ